MNKRGVSIVPVIVGFVILMITVLLFTDLLFGFRRQEKDLQKRFTQIELVALVASQFQNYTRDQAKCFCCKALESALPTGVTLTRASVPTDCNMFKSCENIQPLHGFRKPNGLQVTSASSDTTFVTVSECSEMMAGVLKLKLVGVWGQNANQKSELSFIKGNY